jgi:hypothetical protein
MKKFLIIGIIILIGFLLFKFVLQDPIQVQIECGRTTMDVLNKRITAIDADPKQTAGRVNDGIIQEDTRQRLIDQQRKDYQNCLQGKSVWF